jgi:hypothetical protein
MANNGNECILEMWGWWVYSDILFNYYIFCYFARNLKLEDYVIFQTDPPVRIYNIFPRNLINGTIFGKGLLETKCVI